MPPSRTPHIYITIGLNASVEDIQQINISQITTKTVITYSPPQKFSRIAASKTYDNYLVCSDISASAALYYV